MGIALVDVVDLTKRYGALTALDGVSLHIRGAEVLGLIGPNGAGKTTLLECLAGLLPYEAGTVRIDGIPVAGGRPVPEVFYLPDGITPWPAETVRWALDFTIGFFHGRTAERDQIIARLALEPFLDSSIGTLSKGQRKRAMLAIGLLTPHPILLCDEPFDGLDLRQTREISVALRDHVARGRTLFLSIHQIADAARVCDRFVLLSEGRVRGAGTPGELSAAAARLGHDITPADGLEELFLALT